MSSTCGLSKEGITSEENDELEEPDRVPALQAPNQLYSEQICKEKKKNMGKELSVYFFFLLIYHNHHQVSQFLSGKRGWQGQWSKSSWKTPRNYGTLIKESKDIVFQTTWKTEEYILVMLLCFSWCANNCNKGHHPLWTGVECFQWNSRLLNNRIHRIF